MTQKLADLKQSFVPVPLIDEHFGTSNSSAKLEVVRTFAKTQSSSSSPSSFARYILIDVNRLDSNQPIELHCHGKWATMNIEKYDVLIISGCRVERSQPSSSTANEPNECFYVMHVDDKSEQASIIVYNWRDRILSRPGKLCTLATLRVSDDDSSSNPPKPKRRRMGVVESSDAYTYLPLNQLRPGMEAINIYGIIRGMGLIKRTSGTDFSRILWLSDTSMEHDAGIKFTMFRRDEASFPDLQVGDIIRIHRTEVNLFQGQLVGAIKERQKCSFICLRGYPHDGVEPYYKSSPTYTDVDPEILKHLQSSTQSKNLQNKVDLSSQYLKQLKDVATLPHQTYFDLHVQILAIDFQKRGFFVWDGTDIPEADQPKLKQYPHFFIPNCPEFGSIVRISLGENSWLERELQQTVLRSWLQVRNLQAYGSPDGLTLRFHNQSKIVSLSQEKVKELQESIQGKIQQANRLRPLTSITHRPCAKSIYLGCSFTPIKQILEATNSTQKFRCRARIIACVPAETREWSRIWCTRCAAYSPCKRDGNDVCILCNTSESIRYEYLVHIVLEDATGIFAVTAFGDHATNLFPYLAPDNLYMSTTTASELHQLHTFAMQLGHWIDCCVINIPLPKEATQASMSLSMDYWDLSDSLLSSSDSYPMDDPAIFDTGIHSTTEIRRALTAPSKRFYITDTTFLPLSS